MRRSKPPAAHYFTDEGTSVPHIGPYCLVEQLGEGGMGVVFRAKHLTTGQTLAVKTARDTSQAAVASMRREVEILEQLDHPGVVALVDHGDVDGVPWLAMELLEGSTLLDLLAQTAPSFDSRTGLAAAKTTGHAFALDRLFDGPGPHAAVPVAATSRPVRSRFELAQARPALEVLGRLCHTLAHLHSEGVVHGDLKPSNVFLRDKRTPVLVDFGLMAWFEGAHSRERIVASDQRLGGTLQYMAPEHLRGKLVDARADLYAIGCMLYLAVTGQLPFDAARPEQVIANHLEGAYAPPGERVEGLPVELASLIERLLAAEPEHRLGHADVVARAISRVIGVAAPALEEGCPSASIHLHKPSFVGRDDLLDELLDDLGADGSADAHTEASDHPQAAPDHLLLIGGLAGVGRTRFAKELASAAERRGFRVTLASADLGPGSGEHGGHAPPLWAFRPTLRAIADHCRDQGAQETARVIGRRASVLARYERSLAQLPGGAEQKQPVKLPARAAKARTFTYLTETLVAFAASRPMLVVIDDLHLADELSLEFLAKVRQVGGMDNVFVAGTFRLEQRAELAPLLQGSTRLFELEVLPDEAVGALVGDMLTLPQPPRKFVDLVVAESGGNPYVVSEYVHAAVEQGLLRRREDGSWHVRTHVAERGDSRGALSVSRRLTALIEGRLERLEPQERQILELASVAGRRVERELLFELSGLERERLEAVLSQLFRRRLLADNGSSVRLAEQVRRIAYDSLDGPVRSRLHRQVARALERRAPEQVNLLRLAEQWRGAGVRARELCYIEKAAEQALSHGASATTHSLLARGLELVEQIEADGAPDMRVRRARLVRLLALAHRSAGQLDRAVELLECSLGELGCVLPEAPIRWGAKGAWALMCQFGHMLVPQGFDARPASENARLREVLESGLALVWPLVQCGQVRRAAVLSLMLANFADRFDDGRSYALPYAALGEGYHHLGLEPLAEFYRSRARANLIDGPQHPTDFVGAIFLFINRSAGCGDWSRTARLLEHAISYCEQVGDRLGCESLLVVKGVVDVLRDRLEPVEVLAARLEQRATSNGNPFLGSWSQLILAMIARQSGEHRRALALLEQLPSQLDQIPELVVHGHVLALEASSRAALGDSEAALARALRAMSIFRQLTDAGDFNFSLYHLYQCLAQAFLTCWQDVELDDDAREGALAHARILTRRLESLAGRFAAASPAALRSRGLLEAIDGRFGRASALLSESLLAARRYDLGFEDRLTRRAAASLGTLPVA